jgi:soluble lytic murein transglycosylase-like protein
MRDQSNQPAKTVRVILTEPQRAILVGLLALLILVLQAGVIYVQYDSLLVKHLAAGLMTDPTTLAAASQANSQARNVSAGQTMTDPSAEAEIDYEAMFQEIAPQYGLDWHLLAELAYQESRMNPQALGQSHDMGLMQIIPSTWDEWAPRVGVSDPFDPYSNTLVAAAYLAYIRDYTAAKGYPEERWMLVGYNWGPDNLRRLFEDKGDFDDVPEKQRHYALAILQAHTDELARWQGEVSKK